MPDLVVFYTYFFISDFMVFITYIRHAIQQRSRMFLPTPVHLPRESRSKSQSVINCFSFKINFEFNFILAVTRSSDCS